MARKGKPNPNAGRPPGAQNKATLEFKDAVNKLIDFATPHMIDWLSEIDDPNKRLEHVFKFAQFGYPLLARSELTGKDGGAIETRDVTPADRAVIERYTKQLTGQTK